MATMWSIFKGAVLCRLPQPVAMTRDPSLSKDASPAPPGPGVSFDIWPDETSIATPFAHHRHRWCKQQQIPSNHFMRSCATCHRRLSPHNDIYVYQGDIGFCSPQCRERRIRLDDNEMADKRY